MWQDPLIRAILGTLGSCAGAIVAWTLTHYWFVALNPRGFWWHTPPAMTWRETVLIGLCVISGAAVGFALTQWRHLPKDDAPPLQ